MFSTLSIVFRNPSLRVSTLAIFFFGLAGAAVQPYRSLIGITELGLSDQSYSLLIFLAAVVNVSASVLIGILADRLGSYRGAMIVVTLFGIAGYGMTYFLPHIGVFIFAMLVMLPVFGALNSLIFANVRAGAKDMPARDLISVNSMVRASISLSWVLVPGLVGIHLAGGASMLPAFLYAALGCVACLVLFVGFLPSAHVPAVSGAKFALFASLGQIAAPKVMLRVLAVALISQMLHVNDTVLPLIATGRAGGTAADVGIVIGIVALLEIVFIIFWGLMERHMARVTALALGAAIYCVYLVLLGLATAPAHLYLLTLVGGFGAAAIISIPITYLQDLIADRAGLGSSLIAVNIFLGGGLSSLLFAAGTAISDYAGTAIFGALAGFAGVLLLVVLDGRPIRGGGREQRADGG